MSLDALIRLSSHLGMGERARRFVGLLADSVVSERLGGFNGLRNRFAQAGLGDLMSSWIGGSPGDNELQPDQFSAGFGQQESARIAQQLGVSPAAVNVAGAAILPGLVSLMTPNGQIPTTLTAPFAALVHAPTPRIEPERSGLGWVPWLLAALLLAGVLFFLLRGCQKVDSTTTPAAGGATAAAPVAATGAPVADLPARFGFENVDGRITVQGQVASEDEKKRLWDALAANFGAGNITGDIAVDARTLPAGWMDTLIGALPELKARGLKFGFDGDKLNLDTAGLPESERFNLSGKLRKLFGGYSITGLWDQASAALSSLKSGFSADDLVEALNLMTVYFDTGANHITADSMETLQRAAEAIKAAPAGTRIELAGHTDNTGNAASNLALSQKRAEAVAAKLAELGVDPAMLSARGFGQEKPIADNTTEEGRAKNRRIEFSVLK